MFDCIKISFQMQGRKHLQNSRKMKNLEKLIKQLNSQEPSNSDENAKLKHKFFQEQIKQKEIEEGELMIRESEYDQNLFLSQQEEIEYHFFTQTVSNLEMLIESNEEKVLGLENKNIFLINHLENLRKMYNKKKTENILGFQTKKQKTLQKERQILNKSMLNVHHQNLNCNYDYEIATNIKPKLADPRNPTHNSFKERLNQKQGVTIYENAPVKLPQRYPHHAWREQQQHIRNFLNTWLKQNVKEHKSSSNKLIEKRVVLLLYLKWKELQHIEKKNNLKNPQILQIITNQMKIAFNCTCTTQGYEGLSFVKRQQNQKENKNQNKKQQEFKLEQRQDQKIKQQHNNENKRNDNKAQINEDEEIEQEFSCFAECQNDEQGRN